MSENTQDQLPAPVDFAQIDQEDYQNLEPDGVTFQVRFYEESRTNCRMAEIMWHRRETRRPTENTNIGLTGGKDSAYPPTSIYAIFTRSSALALSGRRDRRAPHRSPCRCAADSSGVL